MRFLPVRLRFRSAVMIAWAATPLLRWTKIVRERLAMRMETAREIVTYHLLDVLTRHGVAFDPAVRMIGVERIDEGLAIGRGVLVVGPHSMLSILSLRSHFDRGMDVTVIAADPLKIPGTSVMSKVIEPSFTYLLGVRTILRANGLVCAMIDRDAPLFKTTFEVMTAQGPVVVADALIRLAVRSEASVVFMAARIASGELVIAYDAPSAEASRSAESVTAAFVSFLQNHVAGLAAD